MKRILLFTTILILCLCSPVWAVDYYVCDNGTDCNAGAGSGWSTGNDGNNGTSKATPWKTIEFAIEGTSPVTAGDTIIVGDGTYKDHDADGSVARFRVLGAATAWITVKAENIPADAKDCTVILDGEDTASWGFTKYGTTAEIAYICFEGFKLTRFVWVGWTANPVNITSGHDYYIYKCWFTDINNEWSHAAYSCTGAVYGVCGIYSSTEVYNVTVDSCRFDTIGRPYASEEWWNANCTIAQSHMYSHDHHIYIGGHSNVIKNCVFGERYAGTAIRFYEHDTDFNLNKDNDDWTHRAINNTFYGQDQNEGDGIRSRGCDIFIYSNEWNNDWPINVVIDNNISENGNNNFVYIYPLMEMQGYIKMRNNVVDVGTLYTIEGHALANGNEATQITAYLADNYTSRADINLTDPANGDYTLTAESYPINRGLATYAPDYDYAGTARPYDTLYDVGAYEFTGTASTPGLDNGDMELDSDWTAIGTPTTEERSNEQAHGGTYSWKFIVDAEHEGITQDIGNALILGQRYLFTFWVYGDGTNEFTAKITSGSDTWYHPSLAIEGNDYVPAAAWTEISYNFVASDVGSVITFYSDSGETAGTFYIDDVTLVTDPEGPLPSGNEDYTEYTEVDPNAHITVASDTITFAGLETRDETAYVYSDKGTAMFDSDFEHTLKVNISAIGPEGVRLYVWTSMNEIGNIKAIDDGNAETDDALGLRVIQGAVESYFTLVIWEDGVRAATDNSPNISLDTDYFITIERDYDGGINNTGRFITRIYTVNYYGQTGAVEFDTLTADSSVGEQNDFQYIYGLQIYGDTNDSGRTISGTVKDLNLGGSLDPAFKSTSSVTSGTATSGTIRIDIEGNKTPYVTLNPQGVPAIQVNSFGEATRYAAYAGKTGDTLHFDYLIVAGDRVAAFDVTGDIILNSSAIRDSDGTNFNLTPNAWTSGITIAAPYPSTAPKEFTDSADCAAYLTAGGYFIGDDYIQWTEDATDAFDASASDGTSGHEINYNGQGFTITGDKTFGDYSIISRFIHGSTVILGLGDTHKYSLIPVGDILQVPEGATGCTIHDDSIRGTLDLDETVTVKNTWVTTVDLAGIGAAETATFNNCAFVQSEAVIDATLGGGSTSFDAECQFSITTTDCFRDYAGADYHLTGGSPLKDAGEDTGADIDLEGRPTPMGSAHDIGAYELSMSGGSNDLSGMTIFDDLANKIVQ